VTFLSYGQLEGLKSLRVIGHREYGKRGGTFRMVSRISVVLERNSRLQFGEDDKSTPAQASVGADESRVV